MVIFDSHCHIDDTSFKTDLERVIEAARKAGVIRMMIAGINEQSAAQAVKIAEQYDGVYASVGVHPHDAEKCSHHVLQFLKKLAGHPKVFAWGEIGLDFNRMYSPVEDQEKWFVRQVDMAKSLGLPMIFHERDTSGRFYEVLKSAFSPEMKGVVHCFSGNRKELDQYLEMGLYIGITGILTLKKRGAALRELVSHIPFDRMLIETDAPYLTPAPQKNKTRRNEPAFVKSVLLKLAHVLDKKPEALSKILWDNTHALFGMDPVIRQNQTG